MDDDCMMDTSSDDDLDFNTPLWKRITKDAPYNPSGSSGRLNGGNPIFFGKSFPETGMGERGSPLSEVTGNVSRGNFIPGKLVTDKGNLFAKSMDSKLIASVKAEGKAKSLPNKDRSHEGIKHTTSGQGTNSNVVSAAGTNLGIAQRDNVESPLNRPEIFRKNARMERNISTLSGSPVKGGWRKLSPVHSPKKIVISPTSSRMHTGQGSPTLNSLGSSVHIQWDKNKQMKSTSLESTPSTFSLSKNKSTLSPSSSLSSPSILAIESPILISDTPDLSVRHGGNFSDGFKDRKYDPVRNHGRSNHLLNNLLSDEPISLSESISSASPNHNGLFPSLSPSSKLTNTSTESSFCSPSKEFTDQRRKKFKNSSEKKRRDPVWDFVEDAVPSPEKSPKIFSRSVDHRRKINGYHSKDHSKGCSFQHKSSSPHKDFGRIRQQCISTTSEDDELPLISFVNHKRKSESHRQPSDVSTKAGTKAPMTLTSPSRTSSPMRRRPWETSSHPIKPSKIVISPWRRQSGGSSGMSSRLDNVDIDTSWNKESPSKNALQDMSKNLEDRIAYRKENALKLKKEKMKKSLLAMFSSDEEEDGPSDKKRKKGDADIGGELASDVVKRRKTNDPVDEDPGPSWRYKSSLSPNGNSPTQVFNRKGAESMLHRKTGSFTSSTVSSISITIDNNINSSHSLSISSPKETVSSSYPKRKSIPRTATSPGASATQSMDTISRDASSVASARSKNTKGRGKKRVRNYPSHTTGRKSSGEGHSPGASGLPSSRGTSGNKVTTVKDDSDDEIVIVDPCSYASSLVGSCEKKRISHKKKEVKPKAKTSRGPSSSGAIGGLADESNTVSPAILERFNQMDADEAMARRLQEEFDAEMARSVQQQGPPVHTTTEGADRPNEPMASCSVHARGTDQPDAISFRNFNPHQGISIEVSADVPVQIGNFNWNYDFEAAPLPSLPSTTSRPISPPSPPRRRRRGGRRHRDEDHRYIDMPDLATRANRGNAADWFNDYERFLAVPHFPLPNLHIHPQHGRQRGGGRGRGRRRGAIADHNDGNDYDALLQLADRLGPAVDKRLTQSHIDRLPTFKFHKEQHAGSEEENACAICMDEYEEGVELRRLPCFHGYHTSCIDMWLKKNQNPVCPICRVEVKIE